MFNHIEPYGGWKDFYDATTDPNCPFIDQYDNDELEPKQLYTFQIHPEWDSISSESLLVKILYVDYTQQYCVIELIGEWNDLHQNDFKLLLDQCLNVLLFHGIEKYIFICENVFHAYLQDADYYEAFCDEISNGWMCLVKARDELLSEIEQYHISPYFFWNPQLNQLAWRKLKPWQLFQLVEHSISKLLA
jgi:hypothetical protein